MFARFFLTLLLITVAWSTNAASVLPLGLNQLHRGAQYVFVGRCASSATRFDATTQMVATYTTFEVLEPLKGRPGSTYTIKQVGGVVPGSDPDLVVPGVPRFEPGQQYVIFLPKPSHLGFSSPVGLGQGSFAVQTRDSVTTVTNGRDLEVLLADVPAQAVAPAVRERLSQRPPGRSVAEQARTRQELPLHEFLNLVRRLQ